MNSIAVALVVTSTSILPWQVAEVESPLLLLRPPPGSQELILIIIIIIVITCLFKSWLPWLSSSVPSRRCDDTPKEGGARRLRVEQGKTSRNFRSEAGTERRLPQHAVPRRCC